MKTVWLRNVQLACTVDLRMFKDYAGQPLVFAPPPSSQSRKLVDVSLLESEYVQRYLQMGILVTGRGDEVVLPPAAPAIESPEVPAEVEVIPQPVSEDLGEVFTLPPSEPVQTEEPLLEDTLPPALDLELVQAIPIEPKRRGRRKKNNSL